MVDPLRYKSLHLRVSLPKSNVILLSGNKWLPTVPLNEPEKDPVKEELKPEASYIFIYNYFILI